MVHSSTRQPAQLHGAFALPDGPESIGTTSVPQRLVRGVGRVAGVIVGLWIGLAAAASLLVPSGGPMEPSPTRQALPPKSERVHAFPPAPLNGAVQIHPNAAPDVSCVEGAWRWIMGLNAGLLRPQDVVRLGTHARARKRIVMTVWTNLSARTFWHGHRSALRLARQHVDTLCAPADRASPAT